MKINLYYSIFLLLLSSCIDEFEPPTSQRNSGSLVVEARLSSDVNASYVKLTSSASIGSKSGVRPVRDATVYFIDIKKKDTVKLDETNFGIYKMLNEQIVPSENGYYQVLIHQENGEFFVSEPEKCPPVVSIDNIDVKIRSEEVVYNQELINVFLINVNNIYKHPEIMEDTLYYFHDYSGVYAFESPYQGSDICDQDGSVNLSLEDSLVCYQSDETYLATNISMGTRQSSGQLMNLIKIQPGYRFLMGYSMLIKRHSISKSYYTYIQSLKKQAEYGGTLFEATPISVKGNIYKSGRSDDRASGFFYVESVSESQRFFIARDDIPGQLYYGTTPFECFEDLEGDFTPPLACCDCKLRVGSTDRKPEYWPL